MAIRAQIDKAYIIHLQAAKEREILVADLQRTFFHPLEVFDASTGGEWEGGTGIPKRHVISGNVVTRGMLGCAKSHINLIYNSLKEGANCVALFEDDCEFAVESERIDAFFAGAAAEPWDILLFGANDYVESAPGPAPGLTKVGRFWGTHAMVLRERAMHAALQAFTNAQRQDIFLPADWMYNEAIKGGSLLCLGPKGPHDLCHQKVGLVSAITGAIRGGQI